MMKMKAFIGNINRDDYLIHEAPLVSDECQSLTVIFNSLLANKVYASKSHLSLSLLPL